VKKSKRVAATVTAVLSGITFKITKRVHAYVRTRSTAREGDKIGSRGILLEPERGNFLLSFFGIEEEGDFLHLTCLSLSESSPWGLLFYSVRR
jgi:hypothetical protein